MKPLLTAVFLCFIALSVPAQQPSSAAHKMASIAGSVVKDQGGEPVKKAIVQIINEDHEASNYSATTDAEGHFQMESLEPGRYRILVERTGFIEIDPHRRRSDGTEVSLQPGQQLKDMILRVLPAAAITGRVLDEDGDPMPNVEVSVLAYSYASCRRRLDTLRSERTNDLGEYRIGGLFPGRYFVAASPAPDYTSIATKEEPAEAGKPQTSYVSTYYPGVTDRTQAAPIELQSGEEVPINFSLSPIPTFRVRGTVANLAISGHGSDAKGMVMLRPKSFDMIFNAAEVDKEGNFEIRGVAPGSYTAWLMTATGETTGGPQAVEVTNTNIDNLRLVPVPGGHIRGQLRVEGNRNVDLSAFTVFLRALDSEDFRGAIGSEEGKVKRDGSFSIDNPPPGNYEIALSALSNEYADYFVKSVGVGAHELADGILRITGGLVSIQLIASANSGQIDGTVGDKDNQPARNATVVAIPASTRKKEFDQYHAVLTDQNGHFQMRGLHPGDYTIVAWEDVESGAWCDPDFLRNYESSGQPVHLPEGGRQSVTIKQIPAARQP